MLRKLIFLAFLAAICVATATSDEEDENEDAYLTADFLIDLGFKHGDTTMQMLGAAFRDIEETLTAKILNREIAEFQGMMTADNKTLQDSTCGLLECSQWSAWSTCSHSPRFLGFGVASRNRSCGVNGTFCTYPAESNRNETQTRVCNHNSPLPKTCPSNYQTVSVRSDVFCLMYVGRSLSHNMATDNCRSEAGELVNVNTRAKARALQQVIGPGSSNSLGTTVWINGERRSVGSPWEFTYGTAPDFDNWNGGEPSNGSTELCKVAFPRFWFDRSCSNTYLSVCEYLEPA